MTKNNLLVRYFIGLTAVVLFFEQTAAQEQPSIEVSGVVYQDLNNNGRQDKNEKGISSILISNGIQIVKTDKKGSFKLSAQVGQSIFPILPSNTKLVAKGTSIGNANYVYLDPEKVYEPQQQITFGLSKEVQSTSFTVGAIGDVQVDNEKELEYASKSIIQELAQRKDLAFNLFLGDLVNDNMKLMPKVKDVLQNLSTTSWTMVGNHDRNTKNQNALNDVFNRNFGADTYAFNYADVHFIVLNNVYATGTNSYEGRISDNQIEFLKNDLSHVNKNTTIVLAQHIPMRGTKNYKQILELFKGYDKVLLLSGHTHQVSRHFFGTNHVHEIGAGATCGNWWTGEKDLNEVPNALMQCGSPRGYFTIDFDKGNYSFRYKAVDQDPNLQMNIAIDSLTLVANIFAGSDSTKISVQYENEDWKEMKRARRVDLNVLKIVERNKSKVYPTLDNKRNPLGKKTSSHIWEAPLPVTNQERIRLVRIKAKDDYGFSINQSFYLKY